MFNDFVEYARSISPHHMKPPLPIRAYHNNPKLAAAYRDEVNFGFYLAIVIDVSIIGGILTWFRYENLKRDKLPINARSFVGITGMTALAGVGSYYGNTRVYNDIHARFDKMLNSPDEFSSNGTNSVRTSSIERDI